jgi:predicted RNA binding protein YcfA (HicA-like mRNA interferase family)
MPPTFGQLKKYCEKNGWYLIRNTDHWYYEKINAQGEILRTRVSHAAARRIPSGIWKKILKQLKVSEAEFWEGLKK